MSFSPIVAGLNAFLAQLQGSSPNARLSIVEEGDADSETGKIRRAEIIGGFLIRPEKDGADGKNLVYLRIPNQPEMISALSKGSTVYVENYNPLYDREFYTVDKKVTVSKSLAYLEYKIEPTGNRASDELIASAIEE